MIRVAPLVPVAARAALGVMLATTAGCAAPGAVSAPGAPAEGASDSGPRAWRTGGGAELLTNVAGMNASRYAPVNRSTYMAVSPKGNRVAVAWLHADGGPSLVSGEPTTYATIGTMGDASSFSAPDVIGQRWYEYRSGAKSLRRYNTAHNAPFVVADQKGGFVGLSLPMNANGYAQGMPPTGNAYMVANCRAGYSSWSQPAPARLANTAEGSSLSAISGGMDGAGAIHLFGQGHLGQFQGGFGYQRQARRGGDWTSVNLAEAYRVGYRYYFGEGSGYVSRAKNAQGRNDLHVAFAWNEQGESPNYGLYYLRSRDGGQTWTTAAGEPVSLPLRHRRNDGGAAVIRANLTSTRYGGEAPGHRSLDVAATPDGRPLIVRPRFTDGARKRVQHFLFTFAKQRWVSVKVGLPVFWDAAGNGVAYNAKTRNVNVVLLDPGNWKDPARVLLYSQSLDDAMAGRENWKSTVVASVPTTHYASHLQVREVTNSHFVALFENNYANPGTVEPVLLKVPMR